MNVKMLFHKNNNGQFWFHAGFKYKYTIKYIFFYIADKSTFDITVTHVFAIFCQSPFKVF